jgi:hypothetical protein
MNIMKSSVIALAMIAAPLTASAATVVLTDDFDGYSTTSVLNVGAAFFGPKWSTTPTLDYIVGSDYNNICRSTGACVDLDGSTNNSGSLTSTSVFGSGTYTLSYELFGNGRGGADDSVTISLGSATKTISNIASAADVSGFWTFTTTGGNLSFKNAGGDNVGAVLSSTTLSAVPLPAGGLLLFAALGGAAALRRRKAPKAA